MEHYEHVIKPIKDLIPYARNSKIHTDKQVTQISSSMKEFGFTNPVLIDETNGIIAGHGRILAAEKLKYKDAPCIILSGLTDAQKRAYVIADNKIAENAGWDEEMLKLEIMDLDGLEFDLGLLGFDDDELDDLLDLGEKEEGNTDPDEVPEPPDEPVSNPGDIWILGDHRLMCGDSTNHDDVKMLLDGNQIDMIFTDPPYNVAFNGRSGKHNVIKNDNLSDADFEDFINDTISVIKSLKVKTYYIWCNWDFYGILQEKLDYKSCIVWAKNVFGMGNGYRHQHEFCLFNGGIDGHIKNESDLWEVKKDSKYVHPTQKPVELSVRAFGNHIKLINILDLFGGSGSTLIGAEQTRRKAYIMELDPIYCDVIIERWQNYTGKKATHELNGKTYKEALDSLNGES